MEPVHASAATSEGLSPALRQGKETALDTDDLCADLLRDQIVMLERALAPGGDWDHQIVNAERRLQALHFERENAVEALASLRDALEQIRHKQWRGEHPCVSKRGAQAD